MNLACLTPVSQPKNGCWPHTKKEAETDYKLLDLASYSYPPLPPPNPEYAYGCPHPLSDTIEILSFQFDHHVSMDARFQSTISKAKLSHGKLARVVRSSGGLETSVLRIIHDAHEYCVMNYLFWAHASLTT